ncbi:MAG: GntR family transcriptional regulator [Spirochaetaceae bacterium]
MQFERATSIYQQITEYVYFQVLRGKWRPKERIPSVRELAVELEVNPNTVLRSYNVLQEEGVIYNRRGIGYFVAEDGVDAAREKKLDQLRQRELPDLFRRLRLVGFTKEELVRSYEAFSEEQNDA